MSDEALRKAIAQLDTAESFFRQLGTVRTARIELSEDDTNKAQWLEQQGRPFFLITPELQDAIIKGAQARISEVFESGEGNAAVAEIFAAAASAARTHILSRFEKQGFDVALRPLSPDYRAFKAKHGLSTLIGIYTGHLRDHVRSVRITFV